MEYISIAWSQGLMEMDPTNFSMGRTREYEPTSDDRYYWNYHTDDNDRGELANVTV